MALPNDPLGPFVDDPKNRLHPVEEVVALVLRKRWAPPFIIDDCHQRPANRAEVQVEAGGEPPFPRLFSSQYSVYWLSSPFCEGPVGVAPYWVAPPMTLLGSFDDVLLVNFDSESGSVWDGDHAVLVGEHRRV